MNDPKSTPTYRVLTLPGDGVGPEVIRQAVRVLRAVAAEENLSLHIEEGSIGGAAYETQGAALPEETLRQAHEAQVILLGAVGGAQWDTLQPAEARPERGLLRLRSALELYANLRPVQVFPALVQASPLRAERVRGCDLLILRELTGGIYFGTPRGISGPPGARRGVNTMVYTEEEIRRILHHGFRAAASRRKQLCSVDKANVLEVSSLWRELAQEIAQEYPEVQLEHMYVDSAAMALIQEPKRFDTIVTGNLFGDILSDAAATISGSIGMLPSASLGERCALYEPVHGSAPDLAGTDRANPLAAILSVGMLLRYSWNRPQAEMRIRSAVAETLARFRTPDVHVPGTEEVGCTQMGDLVLRTLEHHARAPETDVPKNAAPKNAAPKNAALRHP